MINIVFIRHADKAYSNSKGPPGCYQHDPPVIDSEEKISYRGNYLIKKYGVPKFCVVSPYLRTRQTLKGLLSDHLERTNDNPSKIPIIVEPLIAEFLGNQYGEPDV